MTEREEMDALHARNAELEEELELLRGVLVLVKEDLNIKNDQLDHLYHTFHISREHKRQEQEQREKELKLEVGRLETEIRAKEVSYRQMQHSLQQTLKLLNHTQQEGGGTNGTQLHEFPAVIVSNVLSYLDCLSIIRAAQMHRNWYAIVMCNTFWEDMYLLRWEASDLRQGWKYVHAFASKYQNIASSNTASEGDTFVKHKRDESIEWMGLYRERHIVERNWSLGKPIITTLNGHNGTITCLQFNESQMVSGSDDGSMMLWSLSPMQAESNTGVTGLAHTKGPSLVQQHHRQRKSVVKLHSFYGHGGPVWALHFDGSTLISGSYDKTVKIWDLQTGICQRTLRAHTGWVSSLDVCDELIASGSWDSRINIWDRRTGVLLRTLHDSPVDPIYTLKWDRERNELITGCRQSGVQVWDAESGRKIGQFLGHTCKNQVNSIKACNERIVSGCSDHTVKVWDRRQRSCVSTLVAHKGAVMSVDYNHDQHVISGSYDSTIKLWDLRNTSAPVSSFDGHGSAVFSLQMDATKIISGSADTTIKIFNFRY